MDERNHSMILCIGTILVAVLLKLEHFFLKLAQNIWNIFVYTTLQKVTTVV